MRRMAIELFWFTILSLVNMGMNEKDIMEAAHEALTRFLTPPNPFEEDNGQESNQGHGQ